MPMPRHRFFKQNILPYDKLLPIEYITTFFSISHLTGEIFTFENKISKESDISHGDSFPTG